MIHAQQRIAELLQQLANSVNRDGKADTASHLSSLSRRVVDGDKCKAALAEISQLAPLAQYADFSNQQERLLGMIQELAETLKPTT